MIELSNEQKFEAIKYRHEDQAKLLQFMTKVDNQLYGGFLTIQIAFGGFLTQTKIEDWGSRSGLFIIDLTIGLICIGLLYYNHKRRKEVQSTLRNCNEALGYDLTGAYLSEGVINAPYQSRPWFKGYLAGIVVTIFGIFIILFISKTPKNEKESNSVNINLTINKDTIHVKKDTSVVLLSPH